MAKINKYWGFVAIGALTAAAAGAVAAVIAKRNSRNEEFEFEDDFDEDFDIPVESEEEKEEERRRGVLQGWKRYGGYAPEQFSGSSGQYPRQHRKYSGGTGGGASDLLFPGGSHCAGAGQK